MSSDALSDCAILVREAASWLITNPGGFSVRAQFQLFLRTLMLLLRPLWLKISLLQVGCFYHSSLIDCVGVGGVKGTEEGQWRRTDRILLLLQPSCSGTQLLLGTMHKPLECHPSSSGLHTSDSVAIGKSQLTGNGLFKMSFLASFSLICSVTMHRVTQSFHLYTVLAFNLITVSLSWYIYIYV